LKRKSVYYKDLHSLLLLSIPQKIRHRAFIVHLFFPLWRDAMSKPKQPYSVQRRKDSKSFILTLNPTCGLPFEICLSWYRKSFQNLPPELANFQSPKTMSAAKTAAQALIQYLMDQLKGHSTSIATPAIIAPAQVPDTSPTVKEWLERFISLEDNPRSARIMGEGMPYSVNTIDLYSNKFDRYIKGDPLLTFTMDKVDRAAILSFMGRLGLKEKEKSHGGGAIAGTRTYEITLKFVRMAFKEYAETHDDWQNPFLRFKAPKSKKGLERDVLEEWEILKLFDHGVIPDPLDRALCAAMFWSGLRRCEIYGLKPEDLDWRAPEIIVRNAWQRYDSEKKRSLGDPKHHKIRAIPFPAQLQEAIKKLWATYGEHEFVFCGKNGKLPGANYMKRWLPRTSW
jgi:site-specific recombinase XerD